MRTVPKFRQGLRCYKIQSKIHQHPKEEGLSIKEALHSFSICRLFNIRIFPKKMYLAKKS